MAKATYHISGVDISVSSPPTDARVEGFPFDKRDRMTHYRHTVTLKANGMNTRFSFYGSYQDWRDGKNELAGDDLKNAAGCFFEDGLLGSYSFSEFCADLGYDEDSMRANKIYKSCQRNYEKIKRMGIDDDTLCEIINYLRD